MPLRRLVALIVLPIVIAASVAVIDSARAQEGDWSVRSFEAHLEVTPDGVLRVSEDIYVDIGTGHGIYRDIPIEYAYTDEAGEPTDEARLITISNVSVDDGARAVPFATFDERPNFRIRIGDPDVIVRGLQRYRIRYDVTGALNPFPDHDELYWNVTGNDWEAPILDARADVTLPSPGILQVDCFQGETGTTEPCASQLGDTGGASFRATGTLSPGSGLTFVLRLRKGLVDVPPLLLVPATQEDSPFDPVSEFLGPSPWTLAVGVLLSLVAVCAAIYQWWSDGRDRWYGDTYYLSEDAPHEETRPPFAHQTIVVEYTPPEVAGDSGRRLRPAEIGLLLDERADTLDVSATIVDLAVRKHIQISEQPAGGVLGIFKGPDYMLSRLTPDDSDLLPYEKKLVDVLFDDGETVKMSDLKNKFHEDLEKVKELLYRDVTKELKLFPRDPESIRAFYRMLGIGGIVAGVVIGFGLGKLFGVALLALPVVVAGAALFPIAQAMPRRTANGWETFRRCLGFRLYMVTAETDRQRFAEEANIFHEYLPYAIVMGCVKKWAKAFEGLDVQQSAGYYAGTHPFVPLDFADSVNDFSGAVSGVMASTPGGSGGSGFSGGGFSGGGVGGGGGGRW